MRSVADGPATASGSRPAVRDFLATNRGGGLYSEAVSQPAGAAIAFTASRLGLAPTVLTLANLVVGVASSATVIALAGRAAAGSVPGWWLGLVGLVGWQVAYALDCSDGQLARVTRRTSLAGGRLDVLCDVAAQTGLVAALAAVAAAYRPGTPTWLIAAFAGSWMVNLVTSVMQSGPNSASMITSRSTMVRVVKLVRDYGAVILVAALILLVAPQWTVVLLWAFTAVNGGFLLASIAFSARASL
jgi:phosphatidylglycerophosphate synthase